MNAIFRAIMTGFLVLAAGCGKKEQGGWGEMVVSVVAAQAKQQTVEETIETVGTLAANESVDVKSEIDGAIATIHFDEGQQVYEGQVLVALDQTKLRAALVDRPQPLDPHIFRRAQPSES